MRAWSLRLDFSVARMKVEEGFGLDRTLSEFEVVERRLVGADGRRGRLIC